MEHHIQWSSNLPHEFIDLRSLTNLDELLKALRTYSDEQVVSFFEWAGRNEEWSVPHLEVMKRISLWINHEFMINRFAHYLAVRIVSIIQDHYDSLKPCLLFDLTLTVDGKNIQSDVFMFAVQSDFFLNLLRRSLQAKKSRDDHRIVIPLQRVSFPVVDQINTYILTGGIQQLSQSEPSFVLDVLRQATAWQLVQLAVLCSNILERYLDNKNIANQLIIAHQEKLLEFEEVCFNLIRSWQIGYEFYIEKEKGLAIKITEITEKGQKLIEHIGPLIKEIKASNMTTQENFAEILAFCPSLQNLDISYLPQVHQNVIEALINIKELNLSHCPWLDATNLQMIIQRLPRLKRLNLAHNDRLEELAFSHISLLKELIYINLSFCHAMDDHNLFAIMLCPQLREISLAGLQRVRDLGIISLLKHYPNLARLDLADCQKISENGFIEMALHAKNLVSLNVRGCQGITDESLRQIVYLCPDLRFLDVTNCSISSTKIMQGIQTQFPYLNIVY
jgi:hypothetical protein